MATFPKIALKVSTLAFVLAGASAFAAELTSAVAAPVKTVTAQVDGAAVSILANTFSQTMYTFDPDQNGVPSCYEECAEIWPPALLTDAEAKALQLPYSFATRKNGLKQLLINGKPVYGFYKDRQEGDILGNGLSGLWHIVIIQ